MTELIVAVFLALIISSMCSLFEAVLYSVPIRHIESLIAKGRKSGIILKNLRLNIQRPITAILTLNTIANTAGAAVAGAAFASVFGHPKLGYFSALFTLAILIFSELLPKTAGIIYNAMIAPTIAYPMKILVWLFSPFIWLSSLITGIFKKEHMEDIITGEELRILSSLSLRSGQIKPYQQKVIENILLLESRRIKEIMTPRTVVLSLNKGMTVEEASKAFEHWEHSRYPVYDKNKEDIVGVVLTKELFINLSRGMKDKRIGEIMRPVHFVVESARVSSVLFEFIGSRQKLFVVLDEYGGMSGVVTLEDILEDILGREIIDESDRIIDKQEFARQRVRRP